MVDAGKSDYITSKISKNAKHYKNAILYCRYILQLVIIINAKLNMKESAEDEW